jgi:acetylglutamate kinase
MMKKNTYLIKLSGKIIDDQTYIDKFISSVKKLCKRNKIVVVHGGGKQVSLWMKDLNLEPKFVDGLRFTDEKTLEVVISILCGLVNKILVQKFINSGIEKVVGLSCIDGKLLVTDIDKNLGFVGRNVISINKDILNLLLKNNYLVLISSVGLGKDKNLSYYVVTNINADDVTYALADELEVNKVIFLSDVEGVFDKEGKVIKKLNIKQIDELIDKKIVSEGMIPKLLAIKKILKKKNIKVLISNEIGKKGTLIYK